MDAAPPFVRESGSGPGVVCLHANASSSAQWRGLIEALAPDHRVLAPDSYGAGRSRDWPSDRRIRLQDELDFIDPVLAAAGTPMALVGHSYGASLALLAALRHPARVSAVVVYEPTLFSLVEAQGAPPNGADGIRQAVAAAAAALDAGDRDAAARHFIDFWMGEGSWQAMPASRKPAIADSVANVRRWAHALVTEPTPLEAFAGLRVPVLVLQGEASPESAHAVSRLLLGVLPQARTVVFPGLGHMAPVTHPEAINAEIVRFLAQGLETK